MVKKFVVFLCLAIFSLFCGCAKQKIEEESNVILKNEYWNENVSHIYEVRYSEDEGYETKTTELDISLVRELENGTIYKLDIEAEIPVDRFPVYLYVTEEKIYRLWKTEEEIEFLESEANFIEESMIVCQNEDLQELDEAGFVHEIKSGENDDIRVSILGKCNEYGNVVGFWERFCWEREEGLIGYRSGYRAEADLVELICVE